MHKPMLKQSQLIEYFHLPKEIKSTIRLIFYIIINTTIFLFSLTILLFNVILCRFCCINLGSFHKSKLNVTFKLLELLSHCYYGVFSKEISRIRFSLKKSLKCTQQSRYFNRVKIKCSL